MNNINEVWEAIDDGLTVHWVNSRYQVFVSDINPDDTWQTSHFSTRNGKILSVRDSSSYWGSIIDKTDLSTLYTTKQRGI